MKFIKINLLIILIANIIIPSPINEQTAVTIGENFFYSKNIREDNGYSYSSVNLLNHNNEDIFYIINLEPSGFILVAADDLIMPILAFSFENNFKMDTFPTNIDYMFDLYTEELLTQRTTNEQDSQIRQAWDKFASEVEYEPQTRNVGPLIQARFDQGTGWNNMCPEDSDGPGGNVLVGCVAVSMAQIMHYWSYPEVGYGSHGYTHGQYGYQFANYGNAYYDYTNMPNTYATTETQELLYHCGVAVNMGYGVDGSGANVFGNGNTSQRAMREYFLFKNSLDDVYPGSYSTSQYRALLQNELNLNRPIIYVGYSDDGGHAWNIDGYNGDYFHNNWGWGGSQNGYFLLSSLNGFNSGQGALIQLEPQSLDNPNVVMQDYTYNEFSGDGDSVANPGEIIDINITVENLIPWENASSAELLLSTNDESMYIINDQVTIYNLDVGETYINTNNPFKVSLSNDITLSNHDLQLDILSFGNNGESNQNTYNITINVSLDQDGYPYMLSAIDEQGEPYTAVTTVKSSPLLIDINNDSNYEIFFGDDNGFFHGIYSNGTSINGFPIELEGDSKEIWGSPCADDIDNDGEIEIVVTSKNKYCYIIDQYGNIELSYNADQYLMGTPSLANLDNDDDLEIVFVGYTSSGDVFAINHDGSNVNNFPVQVNEKILRGVAIYDINDNGKDDIIIATENEKFIEIIYDNGTRENLFTSEDKFKTAPSVLNNNGEIIILAGDTDGRFYGIKKDGTVLFNLQTGNDIMAEPGFIEQDNQLAIFFGSEDGFLYGIDANGNNLENWPQYIGNENINSSPIFADLDGDNNAEVISASEEGKLIIFKLDGTPYANYPMDFGVGFQSSPSVADLDNDGDMEIIIGTDLNLSAIDIKENTTSEQFYWNTYRGDTHRTGSYVTTGYLLGDLNSDGYLNVQDLVITVNIIVGNIQPNNQQLVTADMNNDNNIDVLDIVILVNTILQ